MRYFVDLCVQVLVLLSESLGVKPSTATAVEGLLLKLLRHGLRSILDLFELSF